MMDAKSDGVNEIEKQIAFLNELKSLLKGDPRCKRGCYGRGFLGLGVSYNADGVPEAMLKTCCCVQLGPTDYGLLKIRIEETEKRLLDQLVLVRGEIERLTFWGGIAWCWRKVWTFIRRK